MDLLKVGSGLHQDKYRPDIDGLRALAVSSVVLCHAFPKLLPGGFIGVDIFFVISGYLITRIILNDCAKNRFSILKFYDRRIRRIFPALLAVLITILAMGWFFLFRPEFASLGKHISASTLFSENFLLWSEVSYFDVSSALKPTLHFWSLAIEEQFYILWPLILYVSHRWRLPFIAIFLCFAGLSFAVSLHDVHTNITAAYYSPFSRSWELMIGSVLAYIQVNRPQLLQRYQNVQSLLGLGLILAALALIKPESAFPGFWALLPTAGAFLLISCGGEAFVNRRFLALPFMVWIGLISYPLYLWHWVLLSYTNIVTGGLTPIRGVACIAIALLLATATFLYIERPLRTRRAGKAQPLTLLAGLACILAISLTVAAEVIPPRLKDFDAPRDTEWTFLGNLANKVTADMTNIYHLGNRPESVLFLGDSHVAQYAVRLNHLLAEDPARPGVAMVLGGGCIPIEGTRTDDPARQQCWPLRDQGYQMADQPQFQRIVIGGAWSGYFVDAGYYYNANGKKLPTGSPEGKKAALDRLATRVKAWQQAGKQVIFLLDNPASDHFKSVGWRVRSSLSSKNYPANATVKVDDSQLALEHSLAEWARGLGIPVIDPAATLCTADLCQSTTAAGTPLYIDNAHFNPKWTINGATFIDSTVAPIRPVTPSHQAPGN